MLFMCTDSFVQKRSASTIHCQAGEETKLISTIFRHIDRNELIFFGFCMVYIKTIIHQSVGKYWWILTEPQNMHVKLAENASRPDRDWSRQTRKCISSTVFKIHPYSTMLQSDKT